MTLATSLVARTRLVDPDLDLAALAGSDGVLLERNGTGLAGRGVCLRVPLADVASTLAAIERDDAAAAPGTGPVAFGAVPFRSDAPAMLVIPEIIWGRGADGATWLTTIAPQDQVQPLDDAALCTPSASLQPTTPSQLTTRSVRSPEWWCDLVASATKEMRAADADGLHKVVLAREVVVEADAPFDRAVVLGRLRRTYPDCFVFHVEGFLGASPELLVAREGDIVRAQPMAGTAPRRDDPVADADLAAALLASSTYRHEHQITIDMVYDSLLPWCSYLDYEAEPSVVGVANVQHLATLVEGRLSHPPASILDLVAALHPTPAVNGWPRELATAWIVEHEGFDRGRYAGTVGWVDADGNGTWAVSIRCADVHGSTARLCAGNGIVADSDPATELAETEAKLLAMRSALTPEVL
ncbi:MAG: isochorismate synthase [Microthrixaceae bacterium]